MQWVVKIIIEVVLGYIFGKLGDLFLYIKKIVTVKRKEKEAEKVNEEITEEVKNADTEDERQEALNKAGKHIFRNPDR